MRGARGMGWKGSSWPVCECESTDRNRPALPRHSAPFETLPQTLPLRLSHPKNIMLCKSRTHRMLDNGLWALQALAQAEEHTVFVVNSEPLVELLVQSSPTY